MGTNRDRTDFCKLADGGGIQQSETVAKLFLILHSGPGHDSMTGVWFTVEEVRALIDRLNGWATEAERLATFRKVG